MAGEKILVVDDEPGVRAALEGILTDEGFEVAAADSGEAGLERRTTGEAGPCRREVLGLTGGTVHEGRNAHDSADDGAGWLR